MKLTPGVPLIIFFLTLDGFNYMLECSWNNTSLGLNGFASFHGVGFTSTGLPICKNCAIVALKNTLNDGKCSLLKYIFLKTSGFEDHIKAKISFFFSSLLVIGDNNLSSVRNDVNYGLVAVLNLIVRHWSTSDGNFDTLILVGHLKF